MLISTHTADDHDAKTALINFTFGGWMQMNVYLDSKQAYSQYLLSAQHATGRQRLEEDVVRKC